MLKLPLEKFCLDFNLKKLSLNSPGLKVVGTCVSLIRDVFIT